MHDFSTRAWNNRRQASAIKRGLLAAVLVGASAWQVLAAPGANTLTGSAMEAGPTPIKPMYDASVLIVEPGHEGLQLSARLAEDDVPLRSDIRWKVMDEAGLTLGDTTVASTGFGLQPGTYKVQATYGSAVYRRTVALGAGQRLALNFLLDAGALRVMATVAGVSFDRPATNLVYAASGPDKGRLVSISRQPGEVLPLPAGTYRVESRIEPGNASVVTDVTVRPGTISAVNISHKAGVIRFSYAGAAASDVHWQVLEPTDHIMVRLQGDKTSAVLKPGNYRVEMQAAGKMAATLFQLSAGEEKTLQLGR